MKTEDLHGLCTLESQPFESQSISPANFLKAAREQLSHQQIACLLDSAGVPTRRSKQSFLSGEPLGYFLQTEDHWHFVYPSGKTSSLDKNQFSTWLEWFHQLHLGPCGPMLFPMLTYEAFNSVPADKNHPVWPSVEAVWLLTANHFHYEHQTQQLNAPKALALPTPTVTFQSFPPQSTPPEHGGWRDTKSEYGSKIKIVKQDIYNGNYYQANLSQRFAGTTNQQPLDIYQKLRDLNPSPFMGVFRWDSLWVLSGSPERLVEKKNRFLSTRPIAGTQPRSEDPEINAEAMRHLQTCEKERAEHLMLLDLERNDLGKISTPGSVTVEAFAVVETYSHVHHLVSQVESTLRPNTSLLEVITAMFPGGTITGAPKLACMTKLAALEGEHRGPYTGSFGYIDTCGQMDLNILIRTLIQKNQAICFHAGGGIVADSQDTSEYLETRHKAAALIDALGLVI